MPNVTSRKSNTVCRKVVSGESSVVSQCASRRGFTIIELLIVVGIVAVIGAVALVNLRGRRGVVDLNTTGQRVVTLLREAQSRSASGLDGATWGVHLENSTTTAPFYALYSGTYVATSTAGYYRLPANVEFVTSTLASGSSTNITFASFSGASSVSTTISLRLLPERTLYTITIGSFGEIGGGVTSTLAGGGGGEGGGGSGSGYAYYRTITIDYTKVSSTLTNFPILVSSTITDWKHTAYGGDITDVDGDDLIFTSDASGTSMLSFEREKYVSSTGAAYYWVKIPSLSNSVDTVIYAHYGSSSVSTFQSTASDVWDSSYKGVWHLSETPSATSSDSTSNGIACTPINMDGAGHQVQGRIDGSLNFDGSADYLTCGDNLDFNLADSVTVSAWIDPDTLPGAGADIIQQFFSKIDGESTWPGWNFVISDGNGSNARLRLNYCDDCSGSARTYAATTQQISASGGWYYVVGVWVNEVITLYVNGAQQTNANSSTAATTNRNTSVPLVIGSCDSGTNCELFDGKIDEVRFSTTNRSSGWILTGYNNQSSPSTFYSVGSEQTP